MCSVIWELQVPKGWDKLVVSVVLVETGKTIAKSSKAPVRNGNCRWIETFSESIWIPQDNALKEIEECLIKLVVTTGSSRSGIVGEALVNLASYMSSKTSVPLTLPLKKCNSGTTLQLKIQCLTPRAKIRDEQWKGTNSDMEDVNVDYDEVENKSDASDGTFNRSIGSSSSNQLDGTYHAGEPNSRTMSFSPSGSRNSFDSVEGSSGRETHSPLSYLSGLTNNFAGRQDPIGSPSSSPHGSYSFNDASRSNQSSFNAKASNQREDFNRVPRGVSSSPLQNAGSSKDLLEAAEVKIEELHAEARMWEQNARKLMTNLEKVQQQSLDQLARQASLEMELSKSHAQCDGLKQEIEWLKKLAKESEVQSTATENLKFQARDTDKKINELEDEIKFQKESNANLAIQLNKTQESNIELISILQELEETLAKQKMEIEDLSKMKSEFEEVVGDSKQINTAKQILVKKRQDTSCDSDQEVSIVEHPIRDLNAKIEQQDDRNLELELQKLQEAKKNLESTVQFLEKSLVEKSHEIEMERHLKTQTLMHYEAEWRSRIAEKEENIVNLEAKLSEVLCAQALKEKSFGNEDDHDLVKEVDVLKQKVLELEKDCNELTEENLALLFKLKESGKDLLTGGASSHECPDNKSVFESESEVVQLKSQICKLEEELQERNALIERLSTYENSSDDLENQLQAFKDKVCYLDGELCKSRFRVQEQEVQIAALQQQLELFQGKEAESKDHPAAVCPLCKIYESDDFLEMSRLLSELYEQIQLSLANLKKQQLLQQPSAFGSDKSIVPTSTDLTTQKERVEAILNNFMELKRLFEEKINLSEDEIQSKKEITAVEANSDVDQNGLQGPDSNEIVLSTHIHGVDSQRMEFKSDVTETAKELLEKIAEIDKLKSDNLRKEEEVEALRHCQNELENQISDLQKEKSQLEESIEIMLREGTVASKCLNDLQSEIMVLHRDMDSQVSVNRNLESKSLELESSKHEMEVHLHELEEENLQLSERICGLEAQLRYLTNERESSRLELENSATHAMSLQDEIRRLEAEMEAQKVETKQKLQDMQKRWLGVQEECEYLKVANPKLQATAEGLIEECSLLQKSNAELRKQKVNLHEHCAVLEAQLGESEKGFSSLSMKVEALEEKYLSMLEEISSKEKALNLELDALLHENRKHKDKSVTEESLLNQMYMEKTVEAQNLQREVAHLTEQISATYDEKDGTHSEAVLEVSHLRADKAVLEAALQEVQGKLKLSESNLGTLRMESQTKIQQLKSELAAARQNQEVLMADHEKLLNLLEDVKPNEEKFRGTIRGLELKLKASEYERLQLTEEISSLKVQLERTAQFQDEVLSLKKSLNEAKFENERLEASFQILSGDYEELKAERISFMQKISTSQQVVSELDDCKRKKVSLQEKVLRLEGDLAAIEALGSQEAALKNELAQIRRENSQFQRRIKCLEKEKEDCLSRAQAIEEELKQNKEVKWNGCESAATLPHPDSNVTTTSIHDKSHPPMMEQEQNNLHLNEKPSMGTSQETSCTHQNQRQVDDEKHCNLGRSQDVETDLLSKVQSLENELADALEANDMYKSQLKSLLSKELTSPLDTPMENDGYDRKVSSLEAELKDLQECYLQMSLKCAEVEAQREQLVMKLKSVNSGRKWFS
ncbi:C2 NT-type domain-containing protein [Citrus sinensis]|uniref:myosin-11 isoform X2 n=1 Tax=Citrus clementina TaxID=85681 RepID=UPI000CA7A171|nr:myosin-11 isoform X2 [Citrus x clementina]KAH9704087.1 C2 NT-type domain-containing protein [Citrus sinensis]GAY54464.1 hypothetical protein CUMW_156910 [Citrus unshiu]